jgi:hypothetical protein
MATNTAKSFKITFAYLMFYVIGIYFIVETILEESRLPFFLLYKYLPDSPKNSLRRQTRVNKS